MGKVLRTAKTLPNGNGRNKIIKYFYQKSRFIIKLQGLLLNWFIIITSAVMDLNKYREINKINIIESPETNLPVPTYDNNMQIIEERTSQ